MDNVVQLKDLTSFHRSKVMNQAGVWRMAHHPAILKLMTEYLRINHTIAKPTAPSGSPMFYPEKWNACNWIWFSEMMLEQRKVG